MADSRLGHSDMSLAPAGNVQVMQSANADLWVVGPDWRLNLTQLKRDHASSIASRLLVEFHAHPNCTAEDDGSLRSRLHEQEHRELQEEVDRTPHDREKLARELADVVYVCYGTALVEGIDLDAALVEVHRANMTKMTANLRDPDTGKLLKPPGFQPPNMREAVHA